MWSLFFGEIPCRGEDMNRKHGYYGTSTYISWSSMVYRCNPEKADQHPRYGGRGIKVCKRWYKFENFLKDMGERPEGLSLDRIDNDGNYTPKNCRWATAIEQRNNTPLRKMGGKEKEVLVLLAAGHTKVGVARRFGVTCDCIYRVLGKYPAGIKL